MCFNVIYPTVSAMLFLWTVLAAAAAAAVVIVLLVGEGFRNGDREHDVRVRARTLAPAGPGATGASAPARPGATGRWVEVTLTNPSAATALVAVSLRRAHPGWGTTTRRHTPRRPQRLSLGEQMLGTVPPGQTTALHVWAEGDLRRLRLLVAVGSSGRLRLHRLPLPGPLPAGSPGAGAALPDPRSPVAS